jgi:hypothetical protein
MGSLVQGITDTATKRPNATAAAGPPSLASAAGQAQRAESKQQRGIKFYTEHSRKTLVYENCQIFSPEGELMCNASFKKLQWYLTRELADSISDTAIRLRFQPKGNGHAGDEFYLQHKHNSCVVCGTSTHFVRHSIIPHQVQSICECLLLVCTWIFLLCLRLLDCSVSHPVS